MFPVTVPPRVNAGVVVAHDGTPELLVMKKAEAEDLKKKIEAAGGKIELK